MNTDAMQKALEGSPAGKLTFPEAVGILIEAGVESYFADLVRGEERFYTASGETHVEKMTLPAMRVSDDFRNLGSLPRFGAAQADEIRYPESLKRALTAGIVAYGAFLSGKKVVYFGRKGEFRVEESPRAKS